MSEVLYIFDFDDTLAMTDSHVRVIKSNGNVKRLNSRSFAEYRPSPGDKVDFSEFNRAEGSLILNTVNSMEQAISDYGIENVYVVTARDDHEPVEEFLLSMDVSAPVVIATAGSAGKSTWLSRTLREKDYTRVIVYEDCRKNISMLRDTVADSSSELGKNIEYSAVCILPGGEQKIFESTLRDYIRKYIKLIL